MLEIDEPGLLESDLGQPINLFLGAGFSTLAKNSSSSNLPTGVQLKDILVANFKRDDLITLDLQSVYTIIHSESREELEDFLRETFSVGEWDARYEALRSLYISHVYTTNIDDLPFQIFAPKIGEESPVFHDVLVFGQPRDPNVSIQFIPLHGCVRHERPNYVFTAQQISSAFVSDQQTWGPIYLFDPLTWV